MMTTEAARRPRSAPAAGGLLEGRRILVTGLLTNHSLAYHAAESMQLQGAEIVVTGFGRARRLTERAARALPQPVDVLELDVNSADDLGALADELAQRWDALDGVLHSIAYAPPEIWEGAFFDTSHDSLDAAIRTSVYSLQSVTGALLPQLER